MKVIEKPEVAILAAVIQQFKQQSQAVGLQNFLVLSLDRSPSFGELALVVEECVAGDAEALQNTGAEACLDFIPSNEVVQVRYRYRDGGRWTQSFTYDADSELAEKDNPAARIVQEVLMRLGFI